MIYSDSSLDPCRFNLNLSTVYSDFFPADVFSGSDESLNDLFWFFSRSVLVQLKSLNGLFWFFPTDVSSGSDKFLNDLFWFFLADAFSSLDKSLNDLYWFFSC